MTTPERAKILDRYRRHSRRFDQVAERRNGSDGPTEIIQLPTPIRAREERLSPRETEVLQLVSDGLGNREIGQQLFLSEESVKSHVCKILAKLQARSRAHAVTAGFRRGLIA